MFKLIKSHILIILFLCGSLVSAETQQSTQSLSEIASAGTDWLINKGEQKPLFKPFTAVASRAVSTVIFPICTAVDVAFLTTKQVGECSLILLDNDPIRQQMHIQHFKSNHEQLKEKSLGLVSFPVGILSPDLVTHHFVRFKSSTSQVIPYGKLYSCYAHVVYPSSIEEVQDVIYGARRSGKSVSVMGKGMSQGKQAISDQNWNVIINTSKLNNIVVDPLTKTAKVGAGASWSDLQAEANRYGLAVRVMQASNIFSVGGSISANCHGWDYKSGTIRNTVLALTVVDAYGHVIEVMPQDYLFDYIVGGYGGFGMIVDVTISLTDNVMMTESGVEVSPRDYFAYFNDHIRENDEIDMHLYRLSLEPKNLFHTGVAVNYKKVSEKPIVANLHDEPPRGNRIDRIKLHTLRRLPWLRKAAWEAEKNNALSQHQLSRNQHMRPPINAVLNNSKVDTEWLQEYFVKGEDLSEFLAFLGKILQKNKVPLFNASVRFVKHDPTTKLSYAQKGDFFAVVLFFNQKLSKKAIEKTKVWVREVIDYLIAHDGSYYLPYQQFATLEQFQLCYPEWASIASYRKCIDPDGLFNNGFFTKYLTSEESPNSKFHQVFHLLQGQRGRVHDFLHNIFMQLDEKKFFALIDSFLDDPTLNEAQIYRLLSKQIGQSAHPMIGGLKSKLKSLAALRGELGRQTASLVGDRKINGYVEIGYPGRMTRPLARRLNLKGMKYVITDQERLSDNIEAGFPRPYDKFVPLNDYEPIPESAILTGSVDLVCLYIGLHHIPEAKLDSFIQSIHRILSPGGIFILMDHDAHNEELQNFVDVVHSIFNAATGVSPEENSMEVRNFHSLKYWIELVESHGLQLHPATPLIRKGDSTLNCLIRFDKSDITKESDQIKQASVLSLPPEYNRSLKNTYLTAPEWQNVRAAQRYASFVENQPAYRYPYFSEIGGFWNVYGKSWKAARKECSFVDVAFSEYNLMNLFVGVSMSLEYGIKGILSTPLALVDGVAGKRHKNITRSPSEKERVRSLKKYGQYIENTPFYKYPYFKDIGSYWRTYWKRNRCAKCSVTGLIKGIGMTTDYTLKGIISAPLSMVYGSEALKEDEFIHLVVFDSQNMIESIDSRIEVIQEDSCNFLKHVKIPRYMHFKEVMLQLAQHPPIECIDIAGNNKIQVDVKCSKSFTIHDSALKKMYDISNPTDRKNKYVALEVDVTRLCHVLRNLQNEGVEVILIHDY